MKSLALFSEYVNKVLRIISHWLVSLLVTVNSTVIYKDVTIHKQFS